ncbi:hypothetical protein B0A48_15620 [Cryoendolithus antarcticus]|uniref:Heterokaryon incompatibility domain-containing protein n=1 Tax=Cryoendolithus antarcticus TaxID=1507870 RepID=A0A1V8SGY6_9PEZI|nr:hypothetical protein B0A48_15620 [Cryoendolithus antarcticus]
MSEIYSKARRVLIWLGPHDSTTIDALKFLQEELSQLENTTDQIRVEDKERRWEDVLYLMRQTWFSRRWAIQELAHAREGTVCCGHRDFDWQNVLVGVKSFYDNVGINWDILDPDIYSHDRDKLERLPAVRLIGAVNNIFKKQNTPDLYEREPIQGLEYLVSVLTDYDTSDPRDTINCFRNIAKEAYVLTEFRVPATHASLKPPELNYEHSLLEVYTGFIAWIYKATGCIDILCRRWALPERKGRGVPQEYPALTERGFNGEHAPALSQTACRYVLRHTSVNGYINANELLRGELPEMVRTYLKRVEEVILDRRFIEVEPDGISMGADKRHGLGPNKSQIGDLVCILYGCTVPCILRKHAHVPGSYQLVGECYIYGLMDGEAITCRSEEALDSDKMVFRIV